MASDELLHALLHFRPFPPPGDPGPEIYRILQELPIERQAVVIEAINAARGHVESARAQGYQQIGQAVAKVAGRQGGG